MQLSSHADAPPPREVPPHNTDQCHMALMVPDFATVSPAQRRRKLSTSRADATKLLASSRRIILQAHCRRHHFNFLTTSVTHDACFGFSAQVSGSLPQRQAAAGARAICASGISRQLTKFVRPSHAPQLGRHHRRIGQSMKRSMIFAHAIIISECRRRHSTAVGRAAPSPAHHEQVDRKSTGHMAYTATSAS